MQERIYLIFIKDLKIGVLEFLTKHKPHDLDLVGMVI